MCGIAGILKTEPAAERAPWVNAIRRMSQMMVRRGPDDNGEWVSPDSRMFLGFRRLAILDLSEAGHQPMVSHDESSVLVYNGELYNFHELRQELVACGVAFRSQGDTEVVVEALRAWGRDALTRFNGMFALAWYDIRTRRLLLARDHAGIKPLYYFAEPRGQGVAFGSQYNCLLHTPWGRPGEVRPDVLSLYLRLHHVPPPYGLLAHTGQLRPGEWMEVSDDGSLRRGQWWDLPKHPPSVDLRGGEAVDAVAAVLDRAVRRQRISDVPLGVFLSGGVDSPLVASVARRQTDASLKTFTIGNPGWSQDEAAAAAAYARALEVTHRLRNISAEDALTLIPAVQSAQHEPFGDFSILPSLLVSQLAKSEVTVALSGDGGDELFFGYERPWSLLRHPGDWRWPRVLRTALYAAGKIGLLTRRSGSVLARSPGDFYFGVNCRLSESGLSRLAPGLNGIPEDFDLYRNPPRSDPATLAHFSRTAEYRGQLQRCLKKVDMASMYHSLEVRVPILDREVIDISLRLDPQECLRGGERKSHLRDVLAKTIEPKLISKRKLGFSIPLADWFRGPWRDQVEQTLLASDLYPAGVFDGVAIHRLWREHCAQTYDHKWAIYSLLSLQWWYDRTKSLPALSSP